MKTAAVVIDAWKLPIFNKHLKAAGYAYTQSGGMGDILTLQVEYDWVSELAPIIEAANAECAKENHGH